MATGVLDLAAINEYLRRITLAAGAPPWQQVKVKPITTALVSVGSTPAKLDVEVKWQVPSPSAEYNLSFDLIAPNINLANVTATLKSKTAEGFVATITSTGLLTLAVNSLAIVAIGYRSALITFEAMHWDAESGTFTSP